MNKHTRIILILAALLIVISGYAGLKINSLRHQRDLSQTALSKEKQKATTWQDEAGRYRAEVTTIKGERDILKETHEAEIDSIRSLIPDVGRNGRNLIESTNITTVTRDSVLLKTVYDTVVVNNQIQVNENYQYSDKWADFKYSVLDNTLAYSFRDSVSIVKFDKKTGFLKPRVTSVQVISHSPNSSITGLTQFEVESKQRRLNFGLQFGYGLTNNGLSPYAGVGLTINLW